MQPKAQEWAYMRSHMLTYLCTSVWYFSQIKNLTARGDFVEDITRSCMLRMITIGNQCYSVWRDKQIPSDILFNRKYISNLVIYLTNLLCLVLIGPVSWWHVLIPSWSTATMRSKSVVLSFSLRTRTFKTSTAGTTDSCLINLCKYSPVGWEFYFNTLHFNLAIQLHF